MTAGRSRRAIPAGMTFATWTAADGWPLRSYRWDQAGAARGSMLFLTGRGDFIEKYLEVLAHWHDAEWNIAGFDWRGQGGSGRLLADPLICHQTSFDPLVTDFAKFVMEWQRATPPPHVIVAHSMGAHLTLRLLAEHDVAIDAAVLSSPMIDIRITRVPRWTVRLATRIATALGLRERRIARRDIGDVGGRMTSCPDRLADKHWWKASHPAIASGAPSWGWIDAAFASIAHLADATLARIGTPVLLVATARDPVIDVAAVVHAARILPAAELDIVPGGGHEILREVDGRRLPVIARIDAFLDAFQKR